MGRAGTGTGGVSVHLHQAFTAYFPCRPRRAMATKEPSGYPLSLIHRVVRLGMAVTVMTPVMLGQCRRNCPRDDEKQGDKGNGYFLH